MTTAHKFQDPAEDRKPPSVSSGGVAGSASAGSPFPTTVLADKYPDAYQPEDRTPWIPLTEEMAQFLGTLTARISKVITCLLFRRDYAKTPSLVVQVKDETIAAKTGIDKRNLWRALSDPQFLALVDVERGTPHRRDQPGTASFYDLTPFFIALAEWRQTQTQKETDHVTERKAS